MVKNKRRVVITGLGVVSPIGHTAEATWRALLAKTSGINAISKFDASHFTTQIAAEVKNFTPNPQLKTKANRYAMSFTEYALDAALQAFDDAGIAPTAQNDTRWGIVTGSGMMTAEFDHLQRFQMAAASDGTPCWSALEKSSETFYSLTDFGKTTSNTGLALLIQQFGIRGYASSVHTACASGGQALGLGLQVMRRGDADYMLVGGFDSMINPLGLSSFSLLGALSTDNAVPQAASRPFDGTRNGFVLGEGAAFLILEDYEKARMRGARIYAELAGEGNTLSAYRITDSAPDGDGARQAIVGALKNADVTVDAVDYINAHGTSTKMNDLSETNAIKAAFGERAYQIPVSSTKSQTGHLIAAAGAIEGVFSALSIYHGCVPMTMNLATPDAECNLDYVTEGPREQSIGVVLSNSFGFGGSNSCLVFQHPERL